MKAFLFAFTIISILGCVDLREDSECLNNCCQVRGNLSTFSGAPMAGVEICARIEEQFWIIPIDRLIAKTTTDKFGNFSFQYMLDSMTRAENTNVTIYTDEAIMPICGPMRNLGFVPTNYSTDTIYVFNTAVRKAGLLKLEIKDLEDLPSTSSIYTTMTASMNGDTLCSIPQRYRSTEPGKLDIPVPSEFDISFDAILVNTSPSTSDTAALTNRSYNLSTGESKKLKIEWK